MGGQYALYCALVEHAFQKLLPLPGKGDYNLVDISAPKQKKIFSLPPPQIPQFLQTPSRPLGPSPSWTPPPPSPGISI